MKLEKNEYDELCKNIALYLLPRTSETFKKLGFNNVGDLVAYLEEYSGNND